MALALSVIGGGTAYAGTPAGWVAGFGTDSGATPQPGSGASTTAVSAGKTVGFFEWLRNDGPSNISQLFVNVTSKPTASVAGAQWTIKDNGTGGVVRSGICPTVTPLVCSLGALNDGQTAYLVAAFTVASNVADGATEAITFNWNTTGVPPGKNKSHGDALSWLDSAAVTNNGDAAGDFNFGDPNGLTVADNQKLTGKNQQATSATVVSTLTGAAVGDSPTLSIPCTDGVPAGFQCSSLTSLVSTVEVGNGKIFSNPNGGGTPGIKVIVSFAQAPNQLTGANPFAYHYYFDSTGAPQVELITQICQYSGGFPTNIGPCLTVGNKQVTVWLTHNGGMRF
ncbi:MAG: hypothetical protein HY262_07595 [Chloroflexi bacterium]|nr:hypothetical protein [Chloroflexota bacterium]